MDCRTSAPGWTNSGGFFEVADQEKTLKTLETKMIEPGFWDDQEAAQLIIARMKLVKIPVDAWTALDERLEDLEAMEELLSDEHDQGMEGELAQGVAELEHKVERLEFTSTLSEPEDQMGAIVSIHPGAGGVDSQDWAEMLYRMYSRYIERAGYSQTVLDYQPAEEAGLKDVTIEVEGAWAYGYLKSESGVHRLVRISPYDANSRRHTSFASVYVTPAISDDITVEIDESDLRIDTYRASGAGGQHVNKTSSAVRITHLPTKLVAQSQAERSQHRNREMAMRILRSRLYQLELEKRRERESELASKQMKIEWGSQIRSYVLHPYNMVKDHRTDVETSNVQNVLDGDLDQFIEAYLVWVKRKG
ncbi:peptide chain release factor 2 [Gemmatimonadota bacterium]